MSDEIEQKPVDNPQPSKELATDELSKVTAGFIFSSILNPPPQPTMEEMKDMGGALLLDILHSPK